MMFTSSNQERAEDNELERETRGWRERENRGQET